MTDTSSEKHGSLQAYNAPQRRLQGEFLGEVYLSEGEVTLVIGPPEPVELDETALDDLLADLLNTLSVKDAATQAAERTGAPRKLAYQRALAIKQDKV